MVIKALKLLSTCLLMVPAIVAGYSFPPLPQCGPYPSCAAACYVPPSPKCQAVADDMVANGDAIACDDGSGPGICIP